MIVLLFCSPLKFIYSGRISKQFCQKLFSFPLQGVGLTCTRLLVVVVVATAVVVIVVVATAVVVVVVATAVVVVVVIAVCLFVWSCC